MGTAAKRRAYQGPAFFSFGFRPFFFLSGVFSAVAMLAWVLMFSGIWTPTQHADMLSWHVHEMLYGYLGAVVAGFLMTAIPNWTGRMPIMGTPLAALTLLWVLGRFSLWLTGLGVLWSALVDMGYFILLAAFIWREVIAGKNWRNAPICVLVTLLTLGNLTFHLEAFGHFPPGLAQRLGLGVMAILVAVIGGRITPAFTRNWMKQRGITDLPAPMDMVDKVALGLSALALGNWVALPEGAHSPYLLLTAGAALLIRLARWKSVKTFVEPLLLILHIGYFWLGFSLILMGLALGRSDILPMSSALHALTAGTFGVMTLAVMTRATLGHSGRALKSDRPTVLIYILVVSATLLRVIAPLISLDYMLSITLAGAAWFGAFALFAIHYAPMYFKPRA